MALNKYGPLNDIHQQQAEEQQRHEEAERQRQAEQQQREQAEREQKGYRLLEETAARLHHEEEAQRTIVDQGQGMTLPVTGAAIDEPAPPMQTDAEVITPEIAAGRTTITIQQPTPMGTVTHIIQPRPVGRGDNDPEPEPAHDVALGPEPVPGQEQPREDDEQLALAVETRPAEPAAEIEKDEKNAAKEITERKAEMTDAKAQRRAAFEQMIEQEKQKEVEREQQHDWNFGIGLRIG